ncbi:hypothetical protein niasHT_031680 [Heterodera trifolii]|uniref:Uncharacterized protein n=1 Tax=Heterodera trifolii TaxID=157864 RepID=A0ABD2J4G2_9BILA
MRCSHSLLLFLCFVLFVGLASLISARLAHQSFAKHRHPSRGGAAARPEAAATDDQPQKRKSIYNSNKCYRQPSDAERVQKRWAEKIKIIYYNANLIMLSAIIL